jgi:hypothetical protein
VSSIRPVARPQIATSTDGVGDAVAPLGPSAQPAPVMRPRPRPQSIMAASPLPQTAAPQLPSPLAAVQKGDLIAGFPRPLARPEGLFERAKAPAAVLEAVVKPKKEKKSKKGSVCGDPAIKGETMARITSQVKGCGVAKPVRVTSIDGVQLSPPATMDCETATALKTWIQQGMRPAFGQREVVELTIAAHYICRPRNNKKGGKISEHGRGKAIDISGFVFSDAKQWSVTQDYNRQMRRAHKAACGIFGTTLGPGSDGHHEDHLHFDTASYRSGPYCR